MTTPSAASISCASRIANFNRIDRNLRAGGEQHSKARKHDLGSYPVAKRDREIRDMEYRIEKLVPAERRAALDLEEWLARWHPAVPAIGLSAMSTSHEAEAVLGAWKEVPGTVRERDNRARRVSGMQRNIEDFESRAKDIMKDLAPDLLSLPADAAVKTLNERLAAARAAETRRTESLRRLTETSRARGEADTALAAAEAALAILSAGLPPDIDRADLLSRLTQHDGLFHTLSERRTQLITQAEGHDENDVMIRTCRISSAVVPQAGWCQSSA